MQNVFFGEHSIAFCIYRNRHIFDLICIDTYFLGRPKGQKILQLYDTEKVKKKFETNLLSQKIGTAGNILGECCSRLPLAMTCL